MEIYIDDVIVTSSKFTFFLLKMAGQCVMQMRHLVGEATKEEMDVEDRVLSPEDSKWFDANWDRFIAEVMAMFPAKMGNFSASHWAYMRDASCDLEHKRYCRSMRAKCQNYEEDNPYSVTNVK